MSEYSYLVCLDLYRVLAVDLAIYNDKLEFQNGPLIPKDYSRDWIKLDIALIR